MCLDGSVGIQYLCALRLKTTTPWLFVHVQTGDGYHQLIAYIENTYTHTRTYKMLYKHVQYANVYTLLYIFVVLILNPNFKCMS